MNYFYDYLITNFVLLCTALVMTVVAIQKRKEQKEVSRYILLIMGTTVLLSILEALQLVFQYELGSIFLSTLNSCICYVLRPTCILFFILLSWRRQKKFWLYILLAPLGLCILIYILPLIPGCEDIIFKFAPGITVPDLTFYSGKTPLRFTAHIVSALYLIYLIVESLAMLRKQHISRSVSILICAGVTIAAVVIETFFNDEGEIHLLNSAIAISTVFYYVFIHSERNQFDSLTGLYNRSIYYVDVERMKREITAIVEIDMNALKYWNDNFGHEEGDNGLKAISHAILTNCTRNMYAYRLGGDEFTVIVDNQDEETVKEFVAGVKKALEATKFRCSIGYSYRNAYDQITVESLIQAAEKEMYADKAEFYKNSKIDRRKAVNPEGK